MIHGATRSWCHGRPDPDRFHVRGVIERGTTSTPFDMTVLNRISRFHLVMHALNNSPTSPPGADVLMSWCVSLLDRHTTYVREHMEDLPEIRDWRVGQSL